MPCTAKVRVSCKCGNLVEQRICGGCEKNKRPQLPCLPCGPGCKTGGASIADRRLGDEAAFVQYDSEIVRLAERAGVQFVRFLEQKMEEILPPSRGTTVVSLTRNDVAAGKRPVAVELGRVHYGFQHRAVGDKDGGIQLSFSFDASSSRKPPTKLSTILTEGGDVGSFFGADAPALKMVAVPRAEETAEELAYELLSDEPIGCFRLRFEADTVSARFVSATTAALVFQKLTRQAASCDQQEVRRIPQDKAQRIQKLGARPRIALIGRGASSALTDVRQKSSATATASGAATAGGSVWGRGPPASAAGNASAAGGSAWGKGAATAAGGSAWGASGKGGAAPVAVAKSAAPKASEPAPAPAAKPAAKAERKPSPPPPVVNPADVPDSWDSD